MSQKRTATGLCSPRSPSSGNDVSGGPSSGVSAAPQWPQKRCPGTTGSAHVWQVVPRTSALPKATSGGPLETRPRGTSGALASVPALSSAHGYPRWQTAPPTLPHVERQKAVRDAPGAPGPPRRRPGGPPRLSPAPAGLRGAGLRAPAVDARLRAAGRGGGRRGRSLVLASAGSGKTRTIVATLAHLVESGTPAERIMLVTFTRRAAREMVERAARMAGSDLSRVTAGTFHSVCQRLLRRYGPLVGLPAAFTVLDAEDQADVVAMARDAVLAGREQRPALPRPAAIVGLASLAAESGRPSCRGRGRAEPAPGGPRRGPPGHRGGLRRAQARHGRR